MNVGFYDSNEGICYPLREFPDPLAAGATDIRDVLVGASFTISSLNYFDGLTLATITRVNAERLVFVVTTVGLTFNFVVDYPGGAEIPRFLPVRAVAVSSGQLRPDLGTGTLVFNRLGDWRNLTIGEILTVDLPLEEGFVHFVGGSPVSGVRFANRRRVQNLSYYDSAPPAPTPTTVFPSSLSKVTEEPVIQVCPDPYQLAVPTTKQVEVIAYEEQTVIVPTGIYHEDVLVTNPIPPCDVFTAIGHPEGWVLAGQVDETYTLILTALNPEGTEWTLDFTSDRGDDGTLVANSSEAIAVGTHGLTAQWVQLLSGPPGLGSRWTLHVRKGTFIEDVPTLQMVQVTRTVTVPAYTLTPASLYIEYQLITISARPPRTVDVVVGDTDLQDDDIARALAPAVETVVEEVFFSGSPRLQEGYNLQLGVAVDRNEVQLQVVPGGGRGLQPAAVGGSNCVGTLRQLMGAIPVNGAVEFEAGAGVQIIPEKGAHRVTLVIYDPLLGAAGCG